MSVSTFLRGPTFWARIPNPKPGTLAIARSLGTKDARVAKDVAQFIRWVNGNRDKHLWLLTEMVEGRLAIIEAYRAYQTNTIDHFLTEKKGAATDRDLEPFIEKWGAEMIRVDNPVEKERGTYHTQVRTLMPEGQPFRASRLTKDVIRDWLTMVAAPVEAGGRGVKAPNRYRAALSSFCSFLVDTDVITANPVLKVKPSKEAEPRMRHVTPEQALQICKIMPEEVGAFHAMIFCTAMDMATGLTRTVADIDEKRRTVFAPGTKRTARKRTCIVYKRWDKLWNIVLARAKKVGHGRLFPTMHEKKQRLALVAACQKLGIKDYMTKDHRHTWAVQAVKDGYSVVMVAHQLGNNPAVTAAVYARFVPQIEDYNRKVS